MQSGVHRGDSGTNGRVRSIVHVRIGKTHVPKDLGRTDEQSASPTERSEGETVLHLKASVMDL